MTTNRPTAQKLNGHLEAGGSVMVTTYARATIYKKRNAGFFTEGRDGNLYVAHGRNKNCLSFGNDLLVGIRLSR